jgi:hypothetical protein
VDCLLSRQVFLLWYKACLVSNEVSQNQAAATEASEQACNNNDAGADSFLAWLT